MLLLIGSCFNLASSQTAFIINYETLIMAQDAPKRRFLSLIFLVSLLWLLVLLLLLLKILVHISSISIIAIIVVIVIISIFLFIFAFDRMHTIYVVFQSHGFTMSRGYSSRMPGHFRLWLPSWTDWHIWPRSHAGIDPMPQDEFIVNFKGTRLWSCL